MSLTGGGRGVNGINNTFSHYCTAVGGGDEECWLEGKEEGCYGGEGRVMYYTVQFVCYSWNRRGLLWWGRKKDAMGGLEMGALVG